MAIPSGQRQRPLNSSVVCIPWYVFSSFPPPPAFLDLMFCWSLWGHVLTNPSADVTLINLWTLFFSVILSCPSRHSELSRPLISPTFCRLSDVDECETGVCEEECLNTQGSFHCFCDGRQGMKLAQDLRSCKVKYKNQLPLLLNDD